MQAPLGGQNQEVHSLIVLYATDYIDFKTLPQWAIEEFKRCVMSQFLKL